MASKSDQAIALLDAMNRLRVTRDELEAQDLPGAVDEVDRAKAYIGRQLAAITDEQFLLVPAAVAPRFAR